jgi:LysR family glycine cleavage system transcriptional activator
MNLAKNKIPNLHNLQSFICAAKHNSFTQAALDLHLTQSAISRQIKELENQLGTPLFHRVRQRVLLTDSGTRFLIDAKKIIQATEEAMFKTISVGNRSTLNIASLPTFTSRWIIPKLSHFIDAHPDVVLSFHAIAQPFNFNSKTIDLAIHFGRPNWPNATCHLICKEQMVAVASNEYLARHPLTDLADINELDLLHLTSRIGSWKLWFEQHKLDMSYNHHLNFDQFSMIIDALKANLGIALLPKYFINEELEAGTITQLGEAITTDDCYYLVIPEEQKDREQVDFFKHWILELSQ